LKTIIEKIGYDYNIEIVELEVLDDHVHIVVRGESEISPSEVMSVAKSISAREFFRKYPKIKEKYKLLPIVNTIFTKKIDINFSKNYAAIYMLFKL